MKFNPPCYSVTFELLELLTGSSVGKASQYVSLGLCVRVIVCVFLNFYSCDNQSEFKEWGHFSQGGVILAIPNIIKGLFTAIVGQ